MPHFIEPQWSVPGVTALSTLRLGGHSEPPWQSLNLGHHVGDDPGAVAANRAVLQSWLPPDTRVQWLEQVHGTAVVAATGAGCPRADASWTAQPGIACAVMTADCLPVLFASEDGSVVAAAHAGWRGLLAGVLEQTVNTMGTAPQRLLAWLGPAIGPDAFEVGPEVREAFLAASAEAAAFRPGSRPGHYMADLYRLARQRLAGLGLVRIHGGEFCTYGQAEQFFSYRRDGQTGRMGSLILINPR